MSTGSDLVIYMTGKFRTGLVDMGRFRIGLVNAGKLMTGLEEWVSLGQV